MFIGIDDFLDHMYQFRLCWVGGTLGSGKTLFSVALMDHMMRQGMVHGVVANFPTVFPTSMGPEDGTLIGRGVIFDESWTHLDARNSAVNETKRYGAYARKIESYWLFPSVFPVDKRVRTLTVYRDGTIPVLGWWIYRWMVELGHKLFDGGGGTFYMTNPSQYFGMYDTKYLPTGDGKIGLRHYRTELEYTEDEGVDYGPQILEHLAQLGQLGALSVAA